MLKRQLAWAKMKTRLLLGPPVRLPTTHSLLCEIAENKKVVRLMERREKAGMKPPDPNLGPVEQFSKDMDEIQVHLPSFFTALKPDLSEFPLASKALGQSVATSDDTQEPTVVFDPPTYIFASGDKDAMPLADDERRYLRIEPTKEGRKTMKSLYDGIIDMIEGGRLAEADIPDDFEWLRQALAKIEGEPLDCMPPKTPFFMEMKLDRARIGLKLLDLYDDADETLHITYPGIPITRTVHLGLGNTQYLRTQDRFCADLTEYLALHGVKASWQD